MKRLTLALGLIVLSTAVMETAEAQDKCIRESRVQETKLNLVFASDGGCTATGCAAADGDESCSMVQNHALCANKTARDLALKLGKRGLGVGDGGL